MRSFYAWESNSKYPPKDTRKREPDMFQNALEGAQARAEETMLLDPVYYGLPSNANMGDADDKPFMRARESCIASEDIIDYTRWMDTIVNWGNNDKKPVFLKKAREAGLDMSCVARCTGKEDVACAVIIRKPLDKVDAVGFFGT